MLGKKILIRQDFTCKVSGMVHVWYGREFTCMVSEPTFDLKFNISKHMKRIVIIFFTLLNFTCTVVHGISNFTYICLGWLSKVTANNGLPLQ